MIRQTIALLASQRYQMSEQDYLLSRVNQGWTTRMIAKELGVSHVSVQKRLELYFEHQPGKWIPKQKQEAA